MVTGIAPATVRALPCGTLSYQIEARLNDKYRLVEGSEIISWCNASDRPVDRLYFHLYLNAFTNSKTSFMREGGGTLRNQRLRHPGRIEVVSLREQDGIDLLPHASTNFGTGDTTQLVVPLAKPVAPGEKRTLVVRFRSYLPNLVARSGYFRQFYLVAQWYPKLARLEPNGQWATFPYHGLGEFYSDFAQYNVTITVPKEYVVGASGELTSSFTGEKYRTDTYVAARVHDVAWCAYPLFEKYTFNSDGTRIDILAPPGYQWSVRRHLGLIRAGLRHFNTLFGDYPYATLTAVIPPRGAHAASAMEYPTLFVSAGPWYSWASLGIPHPAIDQVVAHELAHQWFQGMIANHEVQEPLLDEGLAQWASYDFLQHLYREAGSAFLPPPVSIDYFLLAQARSQPPGDSPVSSMLPAYTYTSQQLMRAVYLRPALVLAQIGRTWGREKLERALGRYAREYRFKHPTLADLFNQFDSVYGPGFSEKTLKPALGADQRNDPNKKPILGSGTGHHHQAHPSLNGRVHSTSSLSFHPSILTLVLFVLQVLFGTVGV